MFMMRFGNRSTKKGESIRLKPARQIRSILCGASSARSRSSNACRDRNSRWSIVTAGTPSSFALWSTEAPGTLLMSNLTSAGRLLASRAIASKFEPRPEARTAIAVRRTPRFYFCTTVSQHKPGSGCGTLGLTPVGQRITFDVPGADGECFFIRAGVSQPVWQPFLLKSGTLTDLAELILSVPDFLDYWCEPNVRFCAAVSITELCGAKSEILAAVDDRGRVFILACPDESKPEPYASVVADVLAAAGRLWRMSYSACDELFKKVHGRALGDMAMLRSGPWWDYDVFNAAVENSLSLGRFPTLVFTSRPSGPVADTLTYLAGMNVEARAAGVVIEEQGGIQVAAPLLIGTTRYTWTAPAATGTGKPAESVGPGPAVSPAAKVSREVPPGRIDESEEPAAFPSEPEPARRQDIPLGAMPTQAAKHVAKPPGPGTKPGVMAGRRPPPRKEDRQ